MSARSGSATVALIAAREVRQRLRSRSFYIFTAVLCILIIGIGALRKAIASDDGPDRFTVAVLGDVPDGFNDALAQVATSRDARVITVPSAARADAESAIRNGDVNAAVIADDGSVLFHHDVPEELSQIIDAAWANASARQAAIDAGVPADEVEGILSPTPLARSLIDANDDNDVGIAVGTVAAILLFASINAFGGYVLTGVVEEKTTAVVEVLLAHVRAHRNSSLPSRQG